MIYEEIMGFLVLRTLAEPGALMNITAKKIPLGQELETPNL